MLSLVVSKADAQQVVPGLVTKAQMVLGDGTAGENDGQFNTPYAVAFVLGHPEWIVTTEFTGHRVKISSIRTGALICKLGEFGIGEGQFKHPWGVAVTADSSCVLCQSTLLRVTRWTRPASIEVLGSDKLSRRLEYDVGYVASSHAASADLVNPDCKLAVGVGGREDKLGWGHKKY